MNGFGQVMFVAAVGSAVALVGVSLCASALGLFCRSEDKENPDSQKRLRLHLPHFSRRWQIASHIPTRQEIRRHMLLGVYCNPHDPRAVIHRPNGRGWTLNLRYEQLAIAFVVLVAFVGISGMLFVFCGRN